MHLSTENAVLLYAGFSAICSAMPELPPNSNFFLVWLHNALQLLGANLNKLVPTKRPTLPAIPAKG